MDGTGHATLSANPPMIEPRLALTIAPLQRTLQVSPGANLLAVLREHGIPVSYSCMAGRCGTCRCRVVSGRLNQGADETQRSPNPDDRFVLACQASLIEPCTIEIPEPDEVVVHAARSIKASVVAVEAFTHDVVGLRLKPAKPIDFSPGQYVQLQFGPDMARPYSMAGLMEDDTLAFHVRVVPGGRVSAFIARELQTGASVRVSGPLGCAYLRRKHTAAMLCVAGGTGLAPILSIVRGALRSGMQNPMHVYVGARSPRDVYGLPWLQALADVHDNLHVQVVVASAAEGGPHREGLVTDAIAQDLPGLEGWRAYLCGSPGMVEASSRLVTRLGVRPHHIHADAFYPQGA